MAAAVPDDAPVGAVRRPAAPSLDIVVDRTPVRKLDFVDIDPTPMRPPRRRPTPEGRDVPTAAGERSLDEVTEFATSSIELGEPRWSLWGDAEI